MYVSSGQFNQDAFTTSNKKEHSKKIEDTQTYTHARTKVCSSLSPIDRLHGLLRIQPPLLKERSLQPTKATGDG